MLLLAAITPADDWLCDLDQHDADVATIAQALLDEHERVLQERLLHGPPPLGPGAPPARAARPRGLTARQIGDGLRTLALRLLARA